jgi:hypothetical protein
MNAGRRTGREVLAVLDDATAGKSMLEWSGMLAQAVRGDLAVVYVESTLALRAAALPITRVLSHLGGEWVAFDASDVERGYRAQAERLRAQVERVAARHAVRCSLRTARGALVQQALAVADASALVLVAPTVRWPSPTRTPGPPRVLVLLEPGVTAERARRLAHELGRRLSGRCSERTVEPSALGAALDEASADLIVLPLALAEPVAVARARQPVLLVGEAFDDNGARPPSA